MPTFSLVFGSSRSPSYRRAAALAVDLPEASVEGEGSERLHRVPITPANFRAVAELIGLVASWKRTVVELDGVPLPYRGGTFALQFVVGCWQEREVTGLEELHCWGVGHHGHGRIPCRLLDRRLPESWVGALADPATLQRVITGQARAQATLCCPAFDLTEVLAAAAESRLRHELGDPPSPAPEETRLRRLLDGVDLGDD